MLHSHRPLPATVVLGLVFTLLAATPSVATGQDSKDAKTRTARGKVTKVESAESQLTVTTREGRVLHFQTDADSKLRLAGKDVKLTEFKEGTRVRVTYDVRDGKNRVIAASEFPSSDGPVRREIRDALRSIAAYSFQQKEEYGRKMKAAVRDLEEEIEDLKERAKDAGADVQQQLAKEIVELGKRKEEVEQKLAKVAAARGEAWEDIKSGISSALEELQKSMQKARARFKDQP
jgi:hypothetical protein